MISKLLIANRGEIAVRVARACRELGIEVVAVYSTSDRDSAVVAMADEAVHIGSSAPRCSYLHVPNIVEAALRTGADAVHPGYGFLSEDPDFAEICEAEGLTFVGPPPAVMQQMGNKATARRLMADAGLPLLPGVVEPVRTVEEGRLIADGIGYPVIIKAAAGGGGRGMTVVHTAEDFAEAFTGTRAVARAVFRDPTVYIERYLPRARHVEVQILCDAHGNGVHLGQRDCSLQRRHQKLLEEGPPAHLSPEQQAALGAVAVQGALSVGYVGAGTMEFLVDGAGSAYFMEVNARIQVEHPVTELLTGVDLVREQLLVAGGRPLRLRQEDVVLRGAAIECRINAEDPVRGFAPAPGRLDVLRVPDGPWTRFDSGYRQGDEVSPHYDSLLGKLVVWAPDRAQAIRRMDRALAETRVDGPGVHTTIALHRALLRDPDVRADRHDVQFLDRHLPELLDRAAALAADPSAVLPPDDPDPLDVPAGPEQTASLHLHTVTDATDATDGRKPPVPATTFTLDDLMGLLTEKAGLPATSHTSDPDAKFEDVGLDSLAFLSMQTELQERYGVEMPDDKPDHYTFGEIVEVVSSQLNQAEPAPAEAS
ncbi:acetyl-CoA carboxylase biotin carboxylase subunit [Geodermatophilus sp. TF02-6]|uniref:acetyl-CoA carboxylase biotin carboxylase subunit n=1 Tax=Geodermatophilus sp. TF02-6 TaxID=2250575 RepID=UPI000DEB6430|nr:acetyl-CoA carboxylase biotin carboxylase subunit [Geodermatophilus sp. TF02-6]RBY75097.1 acetyl-CoA carboxylase biotin carboxylase subunit [Geodermatophilus sp. TF02-6]